ncbi:sigma-70 family RNA polymerase sigma factor [bacterium]|nr:sigma-70 family RNA polymerase sigma factor [candidate division CSSED10-310 bacterium]
MSSELRLLHLAQDGDKEAFATLVKRYRGTLFKFAMSRCRNREDALDTMQETFLKAFQNLDKFRGDARLLTWLYRIASNACLMSRRRSKFAPERLEPLEITSASNEEQTHMPTAFTDPETEYARDELSAALGRAIEGLDKEKRMVLMLRDLEEMNTKDAAVALGITEAAVKSRLHRARRELRVKIELELTRGVS